MTYALCDNEECLHHDGDDCTLEAVNLQTQCDNTLCCLDYEPSEEGDDE